MQSVLPLKLGFFCRKGITKNQNVAVAIALVINRKRLDINGLRLAPAIISLRKSSDPGEIAINGFKPHP